MRRGGGRRLPLLYSVECAYRLELKRARVLVWEGRSPRELTKAFKTFSLGAPPTGVLRGYEPLGKKKKKLLSFGEQLSFKLEGG